MVSEQETGARAMKSSVPPAGGPTATPQGSSAADAGPLGLAGFAMTTAMLSVFNANLISDPKLASSVLPLALFYGGLVQLLAGMWAFAKGNTFGATAFSSYGGFWLSYFFLVRYTAGGFPIHDANQAIGLYLLVWCIFTGYMTIAAMRTTGAVLGVFVFLTATYLVLAIGEFATNASVTKAGGWLGIITALIAWYASFAEVTNATWKRTIIPVVPLAK